MRQDRMFIYVVSTSADMAATVWVQCMKLRDLGQVADFDTMGRSVKAQMKRASKLGANYVLIPQEKALPGHWENTRVIIRDMKTGKQRSAQFIELLYTLGVRGPKPWYKKLLSYIISLFQRRRHYVKHTIIILIIATVIFFAANFIYSAVEPGLMAKIAVSQLQDSVVTYSAIQTLIVGRVIPKVFVVLYVITVVLTVSCGVTRLALEETDEDDSDPNVGAGPTV